MKVKIILFSSIVAGFVLTSCNSEFVRETIQANIEKSCIEKAAGQLGDKGDEYCKCAAVELMKGKTSEQIMQMEKDITSGKMTAEQMVELVKPCVENMYETAKNPGSIYRQNFLKVCNGSLVGQGDKAKVKEYCDCSVEAIVNNLTPDELKKMDQNPNDTEIKTKAEAAIKNCIEAFSK